MDASGATSPPELSAATAWPLEPGHDRTVVRLLDFVEVRAETTTDVPAVLPEATHLASPAEPRWSLWGDAEA
jgi:hypothetical protein